MNILRRTLLFACIAGLMLAQDPLKTLPENYRLIFENPSVRVIRVVYHPLEKLPAHDHPATPTVYVYPSDSGPVRISHVEEKPFSLIRPPETAGTFRFSPGRLERHTVENLGKIPSEFLRVELSKIPLGYNGDVFRSPKSFDAVHTGIRTEFDTPLVKIQRIVAAPEQPAEVPAADMAAVLIAFAPATVRTPDQREHTMQAGDVLWNDPHRALRVSTATPKSPGHLLRILVGQPTEQ